MELYHCNSCGASFWQIDQESGQINGGGVDLSNGSAPNIVNGIQYGPDFNQSMGEAFKIQNLQNQHRRETAELQNLQDQQELNQLKLQQQAAEIQNLKNQQRLKQNAIIDAAKNGNLIEAERLLEQGGKCEYNGSKWYYTVTHGFF